MVDFSNGSTKGHSGLVNKKSQSKDSLKEQIATEKAEKLTKPDIDLDSKNKDSMHRSASINGVESQNSGDQDADPMHRNTSEDEQKSKVDLDPVSVIERQDQSKFFVQPDPEVHFVRRGSDETPDEKTVLQSLQRKREVFENFSEHKETLDQLHGSNRTLKENQAYLEVQQIAKWSKIREAFEGGEALNYADVSSFPEYCKKYEEKSYRHISEQVRYFDKYGENLIYAAQLNGIPLVDFRRANKLLTDQEQKDLAGLILSGEHQGESSQQIRSMIKQFLEEKEQLQDENKKLKQEVADIEKTDKGVAVEQIKSLEQENLDLSKDLENAKSTVLDQSERLKRHEISESAGGMLNIAQEILRQTNGAIRDLQKIRNKYDPDTATVTMESTLEQCMAASQSLATQLTKIIAGVEY